MELFKELLPQFRPKAHSVNVLEYADGRLLITWFTGTHEGAEDQINVGIIRLPNGKAWTSPKVTIGRFPYQGDLWVPEQTCPLETAEGDIVMYTWAVPLSRFKLHREGEHAVWSRVIEEGQPFRFRWKDGRTEHIECLAGKMGLEKQAIVFQGKAILREPDQGPTGGWLIPYHTERAPLMFHSRVLIVEGDGMTMEPNKVDLYKPPGCLEPALAQLGGKNWLCMMRYGKRGEGFIWRSESEDGGRTFSEPMLTNLRNPYSAVDIAVGQSRRLLIAYNDSHLLRTPLTVGLSEDGGRTFRARDIEMEAGEFSYPKLFQTRDGQWHVFYTYKRLCIAHMKFDEPWLLGGRKIVGLPPSSGEMTA